MDEGEEGDASLGRAWEEQGRAAIHLFPAVPDRQAGRPSSPVVSFDRHELRDIMNVYGRGVADGVWKDYALDFTPQKAILSIYRRASETPLYRVEKDPALSRKQGAYAVVSATGLVLKRGHELGGVLRVLEPKPKLSVV